MLSSGAINASKMSCIFKAVSCANAVEHAALPRPPARWRSAHRRCFGSQFSRHGRSARPSVSASRSHGVGRQAHWSVGVQARMCVAELAQLQSAEQTHAMSCPSSSAAAKSERLGAVVFGARLSIPACRHLTPYRDFRSSQRIAASG